MPLERQGWLWGPRTGFQGIGRLLARPGEDRFCEQYFLPGNEEVHDEVSRVTRGGASWVLAKEISVRHFERVCGGGNEERNPVAVRPLQDVPHDFGN